MLFKSYSPTLYSRKVEYTTFLLVLNGVIVTSFSSQEACDEFVAEFFK